MSNRCQSADVVVCICTYKRPELLETLLPNIGKQIDSLSGWVVRVMIVDNDLLQSAKAATNRFSASFPHVRVDYLCEPKAGVGHARNAAFRELKDDETLVFFDDDQEPVSWWLSELLTKHQSCPLDILVGPVLPVLPESSPPWASGAWAWGRREMADGSTQANAGFGNILIPSSVRRSGLCYVPEDFLSGPGEDTVVTTRLVGAGHVIRHVASAKAYEPVNESRMTVLWVCERARASGGTWVEVVRATGGSIPRLWLSIVKIFVRLMSLRIRSWILKDPTLEVKIAVEKSRIQGYLRAMMRPIIDLMPNSQKAFERNPQ